MVLCSYMSETIFGFFIITLASISQGTFALFLKPTKHFHWENAWFIYAFVATFLLPVLLLLIFTPKAMYLLSSLSLQIVYLPLFFGALWGVGSILFGLSVARIGVALTASIVLGLTTLLGTILPFFSTPVPQGTPFIYLTVGLLTMVIGIMISGYSGVLRDKKNNSTSKAVFIGVLIAVVGGIFSPMLNMAFISGQPIAQMAQKLGADSITSTFAIWFIALLGGFVVNEVYAMYLLFSHGSWKAYRKLTGEFLGATVLAGVLWFVGLIFFGIATVKIGPLGSSVGWAIFISLSIIIANIWGIVFGEWKGAKKPLRLQLLSITLITIGIACIAASVL